MCYDLLCPGSARGRTQTQMLAVFSYLELCLVLKPQSIIMFLFQICDPDLCCFYFFKIIFTTAVWQKTLSFLSSKKIPFSHEWVVIWGNEGQIWANTEKCEVYKEEQREMIFWGGLMAARRAWNGTSALMCQLCNFPPSEVREMQRSSLLPLCNISQENNSQLNRSHRACICHNLDLSFLC